MTTTTLADAKARLSEIITSAQRTHERTTITKNGRPAAVIISVEDLESLEESLLWTAQPDQPDEEVMATDDEVRRTLTEAGIPLPPALHR